jgi:hypothetical protein
MKIRKIIVTRETVFGEGNRVAAKPVTHAVGLAVIENPFAGRYVEDLSPLFDIGAELGERLMPELAKAAAGAGYRVFKGGDRRNGGELEHGHALVHPKLGKPMRAAVGGGKAVISSNVKVAAPGASIDMPFANKDNIWSFDDFGTLTVSVANAPLPDEIVVAMAISDGGRLFPRVGKGPITT